MKFIIKHDVLAEHTIKNMLSKYKHENDIHEHTDVNAQKDQSIHEMFLERTFN